MRNEILGYQIRKAESGEKFGGREIAYMLIGKRANYGLVRYPSVTGGLSHQMFVVNSNYNIVGVKGNYTFSDRDGDLVTMCDGFHPNDLPRFDVNNLFKNK